MVKVGERRLPLDLPSEVELLISQADTDYGNCLESLEDRFKKLNGNSEIYSCFNLFEGTQTAATQLTVLGKYLHIQYLTRRLLAKSGSVSCDIQTDAKILKLDFSTPYFHAPVSSAQYIQHNGFSSSAPKICHFHTKGHFNTNPSLLQKSTHDQLPREKRFFSISCGAEGFVWN